MDFGAAHIVVLSDASDMFVFRRKGVLILTLRQFFLHMAISHC